MAIWLEGYTPNIKYGKTGKIPRSPDTPSRITMHFTVTAGLPNYSWPPHFTVAVGHPDSMKYGEPGKQYFYQHCDLALTSYALRASPAGETNHEGAHNVQIEVITYKSGGKWPDELYEVVAQNLADIITALPELRPALDNYDQTVWANGGYGTDGPWRMTWDEWHHGVYGDEPFMIGHMHVPANTHWDPGDLDIARLCNRAITLLGERPDPLVPVIWPGLLCRGDKDPAVRVLRGLLLQAGYKPHRWLRLSKFGSGVEKAVKAVQRQGGAKVDGIVGPETKGLLLRILESGML